MTAASMLSSYHIVERSGEYPDTALIQRCLNGDTHSFRQLYRRHQPKVRSILYRLCGATHLDDLVQEVFLRAWKGLPKLKQPDLFATWLYRIAWNVATDQRRAWAKGHEQLQQLTHQAPTHQPDSGLTHLHYQEVVKQGLEQLSFEHRTVLVLHDLEEMPQKEVAEILQIPLGTVKSRLFHARAGMRDFLQRQGVQL